MKIKKNDNIMVITGKDKGKTGIVEHSFPTEGRIIVKGINLAKKCVKKSKKNPQGGILDINLKLNVSNAMIVCPSCGKPTRIAYKQTENSKIRICTKCKQSVEGGTK
jgi:large subunit ribosomal protein L24